MIDPLTIFIILFFVFGFPIIFMIYYFERVNKPLEHAKITSPTQREVVVKEIVMIPCPYCGGLLPQTALFCPNCGAKKKSLREHHSALYYTLHYKNRKNGEFKFHSARNKQPRKVLCQVFGGVQTKNF